MRNTKIRTKIIDIFSKSRLPLSAPELNKKITANKSTLYRELEFLTTKGILTEVHFGDNIKRYESGIGDHHHHLVCINCKNIRDIEVREDFGVPDDFLILKHNLEFFGICQNCR